MATDTLGDTVTGTDTDTVTHKRPTVRPDKGESVAELATSFQNATATVLTEYRGLTVKQLKELRRALGGDTTYAVVKNTLTKIAAQQAGVTGLEDKLEGPTAVAFVNGDPVLAAKALRDFAKANPALIVKAGIMDGRALSADDIRKLADLESREVLLAKLAGAMKASLTQAVYLFAAPLSQAARAFGALEAKGGAAPAAAAPAEAAAAPAEADEAAAPADAAETAAPAEAAEQPVDEAPAAVDTEAPAEVVAEVVAEAAEATEQDSTSTEDSTDTE